jgi:hypothetical protein
VHRGRGVEHDDCVTVFDILYIVNNSSGKNKGCCGNDEYLTKEKKNVAKLAYGQFFLLVFQAQLPNESTRNELVLVIGLQYVDDDQHNDADKAQQTKRG